MAKGTHGQFAAEIDRGFVNEEKPMVGKAPTLDVAAPPGRAQAEQCDWERQIATLTRVCECGGSLNVMRLDTLGGSSGCGTTRFGASKLLTALRSEPVKT